MSSIRILSDQVANQIAAGEVIERPVSVVKELVENSIDAGATRIEIEFRNGGKSFIRIEDNGKGMSSDEALLCLERHATSKIREASDLNDVLSFGFRGEALPSIASVSKFTLRTRSAGSENGTEIILNGGKLLDKKECGMPVGTLIEVAHLFNSVPARRKFLKTEPTETAHITNATRLFAVAHPNIAFRVLENGRTVFQSPACSDLRDRIAEIWNRSLAEDLIPIDVSAPDARYRLSGLTAKPGVGRATRRELVTLVNRRPVDSRTFGFAVLDAYIGHIQKGRYPPAFLFLDINPRDIDVNVHPSKREIRFRDEGAVRRFILEAVTNTLNATRVPENIGVSIKPQHKDQQQTTLPETQSPIEKAPKVAPNVNTRSLSPKPIATASIPKTAPAILPQLKHTEATPGKPAANPAFKKAEAPSVEIKKWKLIRLLKKKYALFEAPRGLVMLHVRNADQRVRFEQILNDFKNKEPNSQRLLIPHAIEFEPLATEALKSQLELLNAHGFEIEEFGRNYYRIGAVPSWLSSEKAEIFIRDFTDTIRQRGGISKSKDLVWEAVANLAVKGSYQQNDSLSTETVEALAENLLKCRKPHTSPAGKPTFNELSWSELARRLGENE